MIKIFNDHGEHGSFLTMALNVLVGKTEILYGQPTFDFWSDQSDKDSLSFVANWKVEGIEDNIQKDENCIWIVKDKPMLWAYNICTRAVLFREKNRHKFQKGIEIEMFEEQPWQWIPHCDITCYTPYNIITTRHGRADKKSLRKWYRNFLLNEKWLQRKTPSNCFPFKISSFYNQEAFVDQIKAVELHFDQKFSYDKINDLYNALHATLSYTDQSAHTKPTQLLEVFKNLDFEYVT